MSQATEELPLGDAGHFQGRIACVCASNQNRSMAAHNLLVQEGYSNVWSYGTGGMVRLPGPSARQPNVYEFGTDYKQMYEDLESKDRALYERIGILNMLKRNMAVKSAPEKWQKERTREFDVVICYELRVFDALVEDMHTREESSLQPVHVLGLAIKDNHIEAEKGAKQTLILLQLLAEQGDDWEDELENVLETFRKRTGKMILHHVLFY